MNFETWVALLIVNILMFEHVLDNINPPADYTRMDWAILTITLITLFVAIRLCVERIVHRLLGLWVANKERNF